MWILESDKNNHWISMPQYVWDLHHGYMRSPKAKIIPYSSGFYGRIWSFHFDYNQYSCQASNTSRGLCWVEHWNRQHTTTSKFCNLNSPVSSLLIINDHDTRDQTSILLSVIDLICFQFWWETQPSTQPPSCSGRLEENLLDWINSIHWESLQQSRLNVSDKTWKDPVI